MSIFRQRKALAIAASLAGFAIAIFLSLLPVTSSRIHVSEGEIAARTIRAPRDISFISDELTKRRQDEAAAAVPRNQIFDPSIASNQQGQLSTLLSRVRAVVQDPSATPQSRQAALERIDKLVLSPASMARIRQLPGADFDAIDAEARSALARIFEASLSDSAIQPTREQASTYVAPSVDRDTATLIGELVRPFIVSNLTTDEAGTAASREAARQGVAPVQVTYAQNQVIVEKDSPVTAEARQALIEAGIFGSAWRAELIGASALVAVITAFAVTAGLQAFRPGANLKQLLALGLAIALPVFVLKICLPLFLPDDERHFLVYMMPVAAPAMVLAGFLGAELALLTASLIASLAAFATVLLLDVTIVGIAGTLDVARIALVSGFAGASGVFAVRNADRLAQFLLGGLLVFISVFTVLTATWLIDADREVADFAWMGFAAGVNGALAAFLSAGIFVTLGAMFGVTTRLQLLEMSQLSQPLMLRLQEEAPATFQHSVIVATLAEKGALEIGADALLARVGAYYHDIGKLARPGFFIENQFGGENPHDALDPTDSARIIADHVVDGLTLAREYKLPAPVIKFIPEHHGTRLVAYFYRQAHEEDPTVPEDIFRYPGPKPQTRETAIVMLADSCEATVRANQDHSADRIDAIVEEVFTERLAEGQLDDSDLTLRNVRSLAQSFKATLKAVYHPRIEYPAPTEAELLLRRRSPRRLPRIG